VIRALQFRARSTVPDSALCCVANGVREHLRRLLGATVEVTCGEPERLTVEARERLLGGSHCFLTHGRLTDVFLIVREPDARRLIGAAFGVPGGERALSSIERAVLLRLAGELAVVLDPLCAERQGTPLPISADQAAQCETFVDLRIGPPIEAVLGLGLSRELPADTGGPTVGEDLLGGVDCEVRAEFARASMSAERLARLKPGEIVGMDTKVGAKALLKVADQVVARGRVGVTVDEEGTPRAAAFAVEAV
jgi:flagellar motor switch/type III secretory pathway protein FliN